MSGRQCSKPSPRPAPPGHTGDPPIARTMQGRSIVPVPRSSTRSLACRFVRRSKASMPNTATEVAANTAPATPFSTQEHGGHRSDCPVVQRRSKSTRPGCAVLRCLAVTTDPTCNARYLRAVRSRPQRRGRRCSGPSLCAPSPEHFRALRGLFGPARSRPLTERVRHYCALL